jgi:hypothetical protein
MGWEYSSVVEYLLRKYETLGSIPNTAKNKEKKFKKKSKLPGMVIPVLTPVLRNVRQDCKFEVSLSYTTGPLKKKNKIQNKKKKARHHGSNL